MYGLFKENLDDDLHNFSAFQITESNNFYRQFGSCAFRCHRDLRRGSAAARFLMLWVRILPGGGYRCLSVVSVVFFQAEVFVRG